MTAQDVSTTINNVTALCGNGTRFNTTIGLLWRPEHPHAVRLMIGTGGRLAAPVCWPLDRTTIAEGLDHPAGAGDYSLLPDLTRPDGERVELVLSGRGIGRHACLLLPVAVLRAFTDQTFARVPADAA